MSIGNIFNISLTVSINSKLIRLGKTKEYPAGNTVHYYPTEYLLLF